MDSVRLFWRCVVTNLGVQYANDGIVQSKHSLWYTHFDIGFIAAWSHLVKTEIYDKSWLTKFEPHQMFYLDRQLSSEIDLHSLLCIGECITSGYK